MTTVTEKLVRSSTLDLWTQSFGEPIHPAVLLIMGALNQGIVWPDEICTAIAGAGYHVIRYDHRDTGQSSTLDYKAHPYNLDDMTRDAVAVLDGYGIERAHIVGMSMGGFLGQLMALDHPQRALTLTLLMSSPDQRPLVAATRGLDASSFHLPPPSPQFLEFVAQTRRRPPVTIEEAIANAVESWRLCNSDVLPYDAAAMDRLQRRILARARNPLAAGNHAFAVAASPPRTARLSGIAAPTLVIHGAEDPILPPAHGEALARDIPGSRLHIIPGMGHMLAPAILGRVTSLILEHVRSGPRAQL